MPCPACGCAHVTWVDEGYEPSHHMMVATCYECDEYLEEAGSYADWKSDQENCHADFMRDSRMDDIES